VIRTRITVLKFGNPRRLRNFQAVQHLTRESTGSDWPLGRPIIKRTTYDSVAESGRLRALERSRQLGAQ